MGCRDIGRKNIRSLCFVVENRNSGTINNLVTRHILGGSYTIHDGWRGYERIPDNYCHHRYSQQEDDEGNTSRIEGLWGELRAFVRNIYSAGIVEGNIRT